MGSVPIPPARSIMCAIIPKKKDTGRWALPHGEFGLDVIAAIGSIDIVLGEVDR